MYSGITQGLFPIVFLDKQEGLSTYTVQLNQELVDHLRPGDSVSIDGVCQTVIKIEGIEVTFHAIDKTLSQTTLGSLFCNRTVSVQRSLRFGEEIGGHELAGHIFEMGEVVERIVSLNNLCLGIKCSAHCIQYIFEKGFIGIEGSSITIQDINPKKCLFHVHLIPETLRLTRFAQLCIGDKVNLELDAKALILVETVKKYCLQQANKLEQLEKQVAYLVQKLQN